MRHLFNPSNKIPRGTILCITHTNNNGIFKNFQEYFVDSDDYVLFQIFISTHRPHYLYRHIYIKMEYNCETIVDTVPFWFHMKRQNGAFLFNENLNLTEDLYASMPVSTRAHTFIV